MYLLGKAYREAKRPTEAQAALGQVIAMGRGFDAEARLELARALADEGETDAALGELEGLISHEQSRIAAEALHESALLHLDLARKADPGDVAGHQGEARKLLKRLVLLYSFDELTPLPQRAAIELAEVETRLGDAAAATGSLREVARRFPDSPHAAFAQAVLEEATGDPGAALARLRRARDMDMDMEPWLRQRVEGALRQLEAAER